MSRLIFWNESDIIKESICNEDECRFKCNDICFNNYSKKFGKICHGCENFVEENNKVEPY